MATVGLRPPGYEHREPRPRLYDASHPSASVALVTTTASHPSRPVRLLFRDVLVTHLVTALGCSKAPTYCATSAQAWRTAAIASRALTCNLVWCPRARVHSGSSSVQHVSFPI